jgi:serine/threonine protein kinase
MGTPSYMAPETGASIDERTDVYALGVIFYRMFTGVLPFEGSNVMDILYKHLVEEPRPLRDHVSTLPLHIEAAVLKALSKNKTERFASMEALSVALCQEDEDATRLRRILPGAKEDHPLDTPLDLAAKPPDTLNTHPDEERTEELSEPNAAPDPSPPTPKRERVTLHEKPRLRTGTIPLDTEEIERVEPPIQINTGDIVLETSRPPTPTTPKKDAPLFTLSPSPVITELPTHELPMRGEVPIDTETPRNPIPIFGEVRATPPPTRARQRLLMGLVVFLLLWGVVVVVLLFSAPPKPSSAAPVPQPDTALIPAPTSAASTQPLEPASQPAPPKSLPATLEATPPAPPKKQNKQNSKKSAKKNPIIKGNPDLD